MRGLLIKRLLMLVILISLLFAAKPVSNVSAALTTCRTDPILTFSNGAKLTVATTISTTETNMTRVSYVVHTPKGVTMTRVMYTASGLNTKEVLTMLYDQAPNVYVVETIVTTTVNGVSVKAFGNLTTSTSGYSAASVTGLNGQKLVYRLSSN